MTRATVGRRPPREGVNVDYALDAFLTEHARCWRLSGEDLETHEDGPR